MLLVGRFASASCDADGNGTQWRVRGSASGAVLCTVRLVVDARHSRAELEWTAEVHTAHRRVHVDAALLLLRHAFEELHCQRVALHCDARDSGVRRFAQQLGFMHEATLEHYRVAPSGVPEDVAVHRILRREWAGVSQELHTTLEALDALAAATADSDHAGDLTEEEEGRYVDPYTLHFLRGSEPFI